jgi:hypothetical protein
MRAVSRSSGEWTQTLVTADGAPAHVAVPDAATIAGLLAEPHRVRVFAALVLGARTVDEVRNATGFDVRVVGNALSRLVAGELVARGSGGDHYVVEEAFRAAARAARPPHEDEHDDAPPGAATVLRAFVRGGRLTSIPAQHSKRVVILDRLAQEFEPGRRYTEREVNGILRAWHDDVASLRRYLVDEEFLDRDQGVYWRSGGTFAPG